MFAENRIRFMKEKATLIQYFIMFVAVGVVPYLRRHFCTFISIFRRKKSIIENSIWFLCKTNLGKYRLRNGVSLCGGDVSYTGHPYACFALASLYGKNIFPFMRKIDVGYIVIGTASICE